MTDNLIETSARLAVAEPLRELYRNCEGRQTMSVAKLVRLLDRASGALGAYAGRLRLHWESHKRQLRDLTRPQPLIAPWGWVAIIEHLPHPGTYVMVWHPEGFYTMVEAEQLASPECPYTYWAYLPQPPHGAVGYDDPVPDAYAVRYRGHARLHKMTADRNEAEAYAAQFGAHAEVVGLYVGSAGSPALTGTVALLDDQSEVGSLSHAGHIGRHQQRPPLTVSEEAGL